MTLDKIILVGAGGHALSCIDVIEAQGRYKIQGLIGSPSEIGSSQFGYRVLGIDNDLVPFYKPGMSALVCVGQIKTPEPRARIFSRLRELGYALPVIVSPTAWVSPRAHIGAGTIIMHGATVNADVEIGENCIINSNALIEHGVKIGDHCHVSTGALINGDAIVGTKSFIGSGCRIKEGIRIGQRCIVSMGENVFSNLEDGVMFRQ